MEKTMPALFIGHGNPMNAIEDNQFTKEISKLAGRFPIPEAILCISAHWQTRGSKITAMENPQTIHDFGGFPDELYQIQYPAPGAPELARDIISNIPDIIPDQQWGLDHGTWTILKHMYPMSDIPVLQLSLDLSKSTEQHFQLGHKLQYLREKGILIIGSGNLIHNLRMVDWRNIDTVGAGHDWAFTAQKKINDLIMQNDYQSLIDYKTKGIEINMAVPTPDHFLPLLYILGMKHKNESIEFFNDQLIAGSLSMTSLIIN